VQVADGIDHGTKVVVLYRLVRVRLLDYLIRRYPDHTIVYNIQTIGEVPSMAESPPETAPMMTDWSVSGKDVGCAAGASPVL
jgi:hypothetical protein